MGEDSDPDGEPASGPSDADETTPTGRKPEDGDAPRSEDTTDSGASGPETATADEDESDTEPTDSGSEVDSRGEDADSGEGADSDESIDDSDDVNGDGSEDENTDDGDAADGRDTGGLYPGKASDDAEKYTDDEDLEEPDDVDADDEPDDVDADDEPDDGPTPPSDRELEAARESAPPLDREEALERKTERESAEAEGDEDDDAEADGADGAAEEGDDAVEEGDDADEEGDDADEEGDDADGTDDASQTPAIDTDPYGIEDAMEPKNDLFDGPDTDQEMPLADHIEEMMRRLGIVFLFGGIATLIAFPTATELINYFWSYHIPEPSLNRPRLYGPLELVLTRLKVASLAGVVVGLPVFVYQTYRFMKPGLYHTERRYYLAAVPTSLLLGSIGIMFAHFLVLPAIFSYFTTYTTGAAVIAFGLAETFNLIIVMLAFMAIVFQIPLFIMLAIMMNLVTRRWLEQKRLIFWGAFLGIAFIFSPDPTGMAPIIVTMTMIVLYEGTLALLRWTGN